jgi:capsular exopolysaccharide synthesis family protein
MNQLGGDPNAGLMNYCTGLAQTAPLDYLRQLHQEQQQLTERFGPHYSKVRELQDQIQRIQLRSREGRAQFERGEVADLVASLEQGLKASITMRAEFQRRFEEDAARARKYEGDLLADSNFRTNLERRRLLFNTVVDQLKQAQVIRQFTNVSTQLVEAPNAPPSLVRPRVWLTLLLAFLLGSLGSACVVVIYDKQGLRLKSSAEVRTALGLAVLGEVPVACSAQDTVSGPISVPEHWLASSADAEAYRMLRTNVDLLRRNQSLRAILITSPERGSGKSTTAGCLAVSLARAGRKVLLVDMDLRAPSLHERFHLCRADGLVEVLQGRLPLAQAERSTNVEGLTIITAGTEVATSAEPLASPRLLELLAEARASHDLVLIDSPPLLTVADASILAAAVDGCVLVVRAGTTRRADAERALAVLQEVGVPILGTVLNGTATPEASYGYGLRAARDAARALGARLVSRSRAWRAPAVYGYGLRAARDAVRALGARLVSRSRAGRAPAASNGEPAPSSSKDPTASAE